jgi:hypothetical protein
LYNGLARYDEATSAAVQAGSNPLDPWTTTWVLPELVEAAVTRWKRRTRYAMAVNRLVPTTTQPCGNEFRARGSRPAAARC